MSIQSSPIVENPKLTWSQIPTLFLLKSTWVQHFVRSLASSRQKIKCVLPASRLRYFPVRTEVPSWFLCPARFAVWSTRAVWWNGRNRRRWWSPSWRSERGSRPRRRRPPSPNPWSGSVRARTARCACVKLARGSARAQNDKTRIDGTARIQN